MARSRTLEPDLARALMEAVPPDPWPGSDISSTQSFEIELKMGSLLLTIT